MKELVQIWSRVTGRRYSAVNGNDRELRDLTINRIQNGDGINIDGTVSECEGLNSKFTDEFEFSERKDAIINRLFERRKKGHVTRQPKSLFLFLMLGFFALGAGFFILFLKPYDFLFKLKAVMADGGEIFEMWRKPEVELYCKVYLFNITNHEDYLSGKADKLVMEEIGPYVYRENMEHTQIKFNDNGTLSTVPVHPLTWVEELSEGRKEDDILYLPNIALFSIANVVAERGYIQQLGLKTLIIATKSKPIVKMTAKEFMMGYKSELLSLGHATLPGWLHFDKLGLINRMYDFKGEYETFFTGEKDVSTAGLIDTYKGSTNLPQWNETYCSNVQYASDGTKFKSGVGRNESLLFYRKSLCRPARLVPVKEDVRSGLDVYMYTFEEHLLDNSKYNKKNRCYCRNGKCLPNGLIDVTDCYYGFPIALSYPHFYQGDEILSNKVIGMNPDPEKHETRFWIQPDSGLPLDVTSKFQINMHLGDISAFNLERFNHMTLPMLWFDITMSKLPKAMEYKFRMYLKVLPIVEKSAMYASFVAGIALIVLTVYRLTFKVMFKTFDKNNKKQRNIVIGSDIWIERENNKNSKIYTACEIPNTDHSSDSDEGFNNERRPSGFIKTHSDRIKELSARLSDRVYDSVDNAKDRVREFTHVRNIFGGSRKNSLIPAESSNNINEAYRTDSSEENGHTASDSDVDCKYLEVVDDDDIDFTALARRESVNTERINRLENKNSILYISD